MPYAGILGDAGLAKESVQGTFVAPTTFMRFIPPFQFSDDIALLESQGVSGIPDMVTKTTQGAAQLKGGKIKFEVEPEGGTGETLMAAFGTDTMTEVASFIITTGTNDTVDFDIGAGALTFAIAAGTYDAGKTQADSGTMCALLYAGFHTQDGVSTYTVSFSRTTGKFTITSTAATFNIKWKTGANTAKSIASTIGFSTAADSTGAQTYTSTTALVVPFSHAFTRLASASLPTYSWWQKNGVNYPTFSGCMLNKLDIDIKEKEYITADADWMGLLYAAGVTETTSYSTLNPFEWSQVVVTVAGSQVNDYEEIKLTIENNVEVVHSINTSHYATKIYSKGFKVSLSMTVVVENDTEWAKFIAGTASSVTIAATSAQLMNGSNPYSLTLTMTNVAYKQAPFPIAKDLLKITFNADATSSVGSSSTLTATLVNSKSSAY